MQLQYSVLGIRTLVIQAGLNWARAVRAEMKRAGAKGIGAANKKKRAAEREQSAKLFSPAIFEDGYRPATFANCPPNLAPGRESRW